MKYLLLIYGMILLSSTNISWSQAIQSQGALKDPGRQNLEIRSELPRMSLSEIPTGKVTLLPGLFKDRRELTKAYLTRLSTRNLLQNHMLEAGIRIDDPSEKLHQGWESPHCQLRGHFAGHWLSAAANFAAIDNDSLLRSRTEEMVDMLAHCQALNGGQWVGSIPVKYFDILERGQSIWSPQYTIHKTLMGLYDDYHFLGNKTALEVLEKASDWFAEWTTGLVEKDQGEIVYSGECAGMLELWANLYELNHDSKYLELASLYAMPDLFSALLQEKDALTNDHTNASIPWIQGAARIYEVTGNERYKQIVEAFWKQAVEDRGMFATTGNNAGEFWIPPHQFARFLGSRTQEHCTVYNMIRVAQYLFTWTGESKYADYIERALYNGILSQQNPQTGLIAYFLPLEPGAQKKWGSETHDFWCCHGSLVQAQAMYENLIYFQQADGLTISQFIPSEVTLQLSGYNVHLSQNVDKSGGKMNFNISNDTTSWIIKLRVNTNLPDTWKLRIRQPWWALEKGEVKINGKPWDAKNSAKGFLEIDRIWCNDQVEISFKKKIVKELLSGDENRVALMDGPIVLAAISKTEPVIGKLLNKLKPQYEHQYVSGQDWQSGHYLLHTEQGSVPVKPLYEIADEFYTVYFYQKESPK